MHRNNIYNCNASEIGLRPGEWPETVDYLGEQFVQRESPRGRRTKRLRYRSRSGSWLWVHNDCGHYRIPTSRQGVAQ